MRAERTSCKCCFSHREVCETASGFLFLNRKRYGGVVFIEMCNRLLTTMRRRAKPAAGGRGVCHLYSFDSSSAHLLIQRYCTFYHPLPCAQTARSPSAHDGTRVSNTINGGLANPSLHKSPPAADSSHTTNRHRRFVFVRGHP